MKRMSIFLFIITVLLSSCIKQKEKNDQQISRVAHTTTDTSSVIYSATFVKGNVAWSVDESSWNRVENKMALSYGCFIETGKKSATTLLGSIGDVVQMSEQAKVRLTIEELQKQGESASLALRGIRLLRGKVKFDVKSGGRFTVETPTAKVEVKGTVFIVDVDSTGKTDVIVIEGVVNVIPLKDTSHVTVLLRGNVLRNADNVDARIDSCTAQDTVMFSDEPASVSDAQVSKDDGFAVSGENNTTAVNNDDTRKRLNPTPGYHSKATQQEGTAAAERINREKNITLQKIESEKAAFEAKKDSIETEHAVMKAAEEKKPELAREEAQSKLDKERSVSESEIDAERAKVKARFDNEKNTDQAHNKAMQQLQKERSSTTQQQESIGTSRADDAFDELKKRKGM